MIHTTFTFEIMVDDKTESDKLFKHLKFYLTKHFDYKLVNSRQLNNVGINHENKNKE